MGKLKPKTLERFEQAWKAAPLVRGRALTAAGSSSVRTWFNGERLKKWAAAIIKYFGEQAKSLTVAQIAAFLASVGCPFPTIVASVVYNLIQAMLAEAVVPVPVP